MRKYRLLLALLLTQIVYCQFTNNFQLPKAPEAYLFEKYGGLEVSNYSGKPNITIPLHNIEYGDIKIPLNLSYTSNGIRVDEEAGPYGLGWYFGTGMISQIVEGKDDLLRGMQIKVPDKFYAPYPQYVVSPNPEWKTVNPNESCYSQQRVSLTSNNEFDKYFMARVRGEGSFCDFKVLFPYNGNLVSFNDTLQPDFFTQDTSVDLFKANFFGHEVIFYINPNQGSTSSNIYTFSILNGDKYKIEYTKNDGGITNGQYSYTWTITAPDGIKYFFEQELKNQYLINGGNYGSGGTPNLQFDGTTRYITCDSNNSGTPQYNNFSRTWKITKILDTKANQVIFNYEILPSCTSTSGLSGHTEFLNITGNQVVSPAAGEGYNTSAQTYYFGPDFSISDQEHPRFYPVGKRIQNFVSNTAIRQSKSVLKEIIYGTSKVEFNNGDRLDMPVDKKTEAIFIKNQGNTVKTISFTYDYFDNGSVDSTQKRLRLLSLNTGDKPYTFEYNQQLLPNKNSFSFDYWGFYNGMPNTSIINNPFRLYENSSHIPTWARDFIPQIEGMANRSAHPVYCKAGMLEKINYPTGGSTEIKYELNEFNNYFFPNYDNKVGVLGNNYINDYPQTTSKGYGLRVKEMIDSVDGVTFYKKKYSYSIGKHIPAYIGYNDQDSYYTCYNINYIGTSSRSDRYECYGTLIESSFSTIYQTGILSNGDNVGYDEVTIEEESLSGETKGKIKMFYVNLPDISPRQKFGFGSQSSFRDKFGSSIRNSDLDNGLLLKEEVFDKNFNLIQKKEFNYETIVKQNSFYYNVKIVRLQGNYGYPNYFASQPPTQERISEYLFFFYPLRKSKNFVSSEKVTEYLNNAEFSTITNYSRDPNPTYNPNSELTSKTFTNSKGETMTIGYTYPFSQTVSGEPYINDLKSANRYKTLIEEYSYRNGDRISSNKIVYDKSLSTNNLLLPKEIYSTKGANSYESKLVYDLYDTNGNVLQYHDQNGINVSIIWGYNKTQPVAKLENIAYASIPAATITDIQSKSDLNNNEANLLTSLNALRTSFPNSMITTLTYKPLVGISTITDPKGQKTTYEYDTFGRLKQVKDHQGNLLSENEYHYRTQN